MFCFETYWEQRDTGKLSTILKSVMKFRLDTVTNEEATVTKLKNKSIGAKKILFIFHTIESIA